MIINNLNNKTAAVPFVRGMETLTSKWLKRCILAKHYLHDL